MEFYPENLGEDELPLVNAMGVDYTVGQIKKYILELSCFISETPVIEDRETVLAVLVRLLAFVSMEPVPEGVEPISDCDRWTALRGLEKIRKDEATADADKQQIYILQYLLKGYDRGCR